MNNKLVVVITHPNRSEVLPIPHTIPLKLTITGAAPKDLPFQTVNHFQSQLLLTYQMILSVKLMIRKIN